MRVRVPRVRTLGKGAFSVGARSDWEKLRVWKKEALSPFSFPPACLCRPVAAALCTQRPGRRAACRALGLRFSS